MKALSCHPRSHLHSNHNSRSHVRFFGGYFGAFPIVVHRAAPSLEGAALCMTNTLKKLQNFINAFFGAFATQQTHACYPN